MRCKLCPYASFAPSAPSTSSSYRLYGSSYAAAVCFVQKLAVRSWSTCLVGPCRAGSVCLDVINQTWSPMFGKHLPVPVVQHCEQCRIIVLSDYRDTFTLELPRGVCLMSKLCSLQICSTSSRRSSRSCSCTPTPQTRSTVKQRRC